MKNGQYRDAGNIGYATWTPPKSGGDPKCYSMYYTNFGLAYGA